MTNAFACVRMHVEVYRSARVVFYVRGLASYFRALLFFVSFLRLPHQEEFCVLGRRSPSAVTKNKLSAQSEVVFFLSCAFTATSFALPGCIRAVFSSSHTRAVPSQSARVEGTGRG